MQRLIMINALTVQSPVTLQAAYEYLAERQGKTRIIAGGTDLMVLMNARMLDATDFLDIWKIDELRGITDEGECLRIAALTTFTELTQSPPVAQCAPALVDAARTVGAIQIQNRATIGGNIVNASPAGDSLPVLAAYDADLEIGSARGVRRVAFVDFYSGYRKTVLRADELVLGIRVPKLRNGERDFFRKVGTRQAQAISKVVVSVRVRIESDIIQSIAIGVGSVAPTTVRAPITERSLTGAALEPTVIERVRQTIAQEVTPITDLRSTEHYRRTITGNVLATFLYQLAASATFNCAQ